MRLVASFLCAVFSCAGAREIPPEIERARAAPPELFAARVLQLVRGGRIADRELQVELLQDAFAAAARAREPMRLIAIPATPPDTRAIYRSKAGELRLDALSLESRILAELLTLDRAKARELFAAIPRPALDPRPCEDPLVADASPYYQIAAAIAQSAFSEKEKRQDAHVQFLVAILAGARSPAELAAFAESLHSVALTPQQLEILLGALVEKMTAIGADYRAFALSIDALEAQLASLMDIARANGSAVDALLDGFRRYMINQLNADRCAPDIVLGADPAWVSALNYTEAWKPAHRKERFKAEVYFEDEESKHIGESLTALRSAPRDEWSARLQSFLGDFNAWRPPGAAIDAFHQRATVLRALLEMTPRGKDRDRIISLCPRLLRAGNVELQFPAEWMWELDSLFEAANADRSKLVASFKESNSISLELYFELSNGTSK